MLDSTLVELFKITENSDLEQHHAVDPLDVDNGPFQALAPYRVQAETEQGRETGPVAV